ncbi:DUF3850 domain-containing protein [Lactococcus lactis]|uniref:DUF3850 domain-containing protein n=1 Tax=Lactococcus lactis TaxID=1358 RepID=UPI0018ABFE39|nr:DUF3850 domain-containing protein [Lactococcus lactis]
MKTHELKLDIKYFDEVKSSKKNFEIRKNDRNFQVGDILELKAWDSSLGQYAFKKKDEKWHSYGRLADTIKVKVLEIFGWNIVSEPDDSKSMFDEITTLEIKEVLNDYFSTNRLPDGYVILGIEVVK